MIFDKLENLKKYADVHSRFAQAFPYFEKLIAEHAEIGKHVMETCDQPNAVFANNLQYETAPLSGNTQMEAHHDYIDVQIVLEGEERMYVPATEELTQTKVYDKENDYELAAMPQKDRVVAISVPAGYFVVFFANEFHAPGVSMQDHPTAVHKLVGKVLQ